MIKFSESGLKNDPEYRMNSLSVAIQVLGYVLSIYVGSEYYAQVIRFGQQALLTIH